MALLEKITLPAGGMFYLLMRVLTGGMLFMHGLMKVTGDMKGLMLFVGVCEVLIGLGVFFGVFTRLAALGGAIIMVAAYVKAHLGWNPLETKGELAVMYFVVFLVLMVWGAHKYSLEKAILKKEVF